MLPVIITLAVIVLIVLWLVGLYNGLISLRNRVQEAWAQIDTELKRRHDLIGNLVETVKGYAIHERGTLEAVTQARASAMAPGLSPAQAAKSEAALSQALVRLNAVAEAYPDLKANVNFLELQRELTSTEDRIASARRYYNANVRELNTKVETIPTNFVAGIAHVTRAEYFEAEGEDREPAKVDFNTSGYGAQGSLPAAPATPAVAPPPAPPAPPATPAPPQDAPPVG
jgi:LemA protein